MRHTPINHFLHQVRHQGTVMFHSARRIGGQIDRHVHAAAKLYSHLQPALRNAGYDTSQADSVLKPSYEAYNSYSRALNDGVDVIDGIARHLRGGTFHYQ